MYLYSLFIAIGASAVTNHQLQRSQLELGVGVLLAQFKAASVDKCISTVAYTVANKHVTLIMVGLSYIVGT